MFKFLSSDTKESEKLSQELSEYEGKNKPKLEAEIKEANAEIVEGKRKFDEGKLLGAPDLWNQWTEFEKLLLKRDKLSRDYYNKKTELTEKLKRLTAPVIQGFCKNLLEEVTRIDHLKKFEVTKDIENIHSNLAGARIFIANHNYFKCHTAMQEILTGIETLKNSELENLTKIKEKYNAIVETIPSEFPFESTEGNSRLRDFFFETKISDFNPNPEIIWMSELKLKSDLIKQQNILNYWQPVRTPNPDREVGKIVNKHIIDLDLGKLMDSRK